MIDPIHQIVVSASVDIEGVTVFVSAKIPSDAALSTQGHLISGFAVSELHDLAGYVAAKLPALLYSAVPVVQESLIEVAKSHSCSE